MRKRSLGLLLMLGVLFSLGINITYAASAGAGNASPASIDANGIVLALLRVKPGTPIQDIYADLGQPQSISGDSHQWWLVEYKKDNERILSDGSLLYDIYMKEERFVDISSLMEIWSTQEKAVKRANDVIKQLTQLYGKPEKNNLFVAYWVFKNDALLLSVNITERQSNGKYYLIYLMSSLPE